MNNPLVGTILMYGAIGAIFYFVLLRPQQKQKKEHDTMLRSLRRGDEIVTAGGVVGERLPNGGVSDHFPHVMPTVARSERRSPS